MNHYLKLAAATIITVYAIRYLRSSNTPFASIVATVWPAQQASASATGTTATM